MSDVTTHPSFHDVLWHFGGSPEGHGEYRIRVCATEEELFTSEAPPDTGSAWSVPRGLTPTRVPRMVPRLDAAGVAGMGAALWSSLPPDVRASVPVPDARRIRLKVSGEIGAITSLPWESIRLAGPPTLVVRSVPIRYPLPPATVSPPLRVLLVTTNPKDERLLNPSEELSAVTPQSLAEYVTQVCDRPTRQGLLERLVAFQPHVVHYVGHGASSSGQGCLVLHDDMNYTCWLGAAELAALLPVSVRLVCLSTCFTAENYDLRALSRLAHASGDLGLPTMVVNQLPLQRDSAPAVRQFWTVFYRELADTAGDVTSAFAAAQDAILASPDWASFTLVIRDGTGWPLRLTDAAPAPDLAQAEFEALYSTSVANYITQQKTTHPPGGRTGLEAISLAEAHRASAALSSYGGFRFGARRKP